MKIIKRILETIFLIFVAVVAVKSLISFIDVKTGYKCPFFGYREAVVVSDSMSFVNDANKERLEGYTNQIKRNDVICTNMNFSFESLKEGDIITYKKDDGPLVVHRIVLKLVTDDGVEGVITQGDANNTNDGFIDYKYVNGIVYNVIPGFGVFIDFFQSGYGLIGISCAVFFIVLGFVIYDYFEYGKYKNYAGYNKKYYEDRTIILYPDEVKQDKKAYKPEDGIIEYNLKYNRFSEPLLVRNIIPNFTKVDSSDSVSYDYEFDHIEPIFVFLILPIVKKAISKGKNPFKVVKRQIKSKGLLIKENIDLFNDKMVKEFLPKFKSKNKDFKLSEKEQKSFDLTCKFLSLEKCNSFLNKDIISKFFEFVLTTDEKEINSLLISKKDKKDE